MRNPNRLLVTGLAIAASVGPGAAEVSAQSGGVISHSANKGGISAVSPDSHSAKVQQHYIEKHVKAGDRFKVPVIETRTPGAMVEVTDENEYGIELINPLVIRYGGRIASFVGLQNETDLAIVPADEAQVIQWKGHQSSAVNHPESLVTSRLLQVTPGVGEGPSGFTDANGQAFGMMP
jgi:hypothetical protein